MINQVINEAINPVPLTAIIVDDEPLAIEGLKLRLDKIAGIEVIGEASDGDSAIALCHKLCPDILFLDLQLPGKNGLAVLKSLQVDILPMVVFVTAHSDYAVEAFELNAIDYLLKPCSGARLQKTVDRIRQRHDPQHRQQNNHTQKYKLLKALGDSSGIAIAELEQWLDSDKPLPVSFSEDLVIKNSEHEQIFLPVKTIRWIDAAGDYMCIHTEQETHVVRITMKKLASQLDERIFKRIHKSTLVNINYIKRIRSLGNSESMLELSEHVRLKVSRKFSASIQALLTAKQI